MRVEAGDAQSVALHRSGIEFVADEDVEFAKFVRDVEELEAPRVKPAFEQKNGGQKTYLLIHWHDSLERVQRQLTLTLLEVSGRFRAVDVESDGLIRQRGSVGGRDGSARRGGQK
jgi:hypothetical protein